MFDARIRRMIDPPLNGLGRTLAARGATANGGDAGWAGPWAFVRGADRGGAALAGAGALLLSRLADGLDGAVARATARTDYGGYLDIVCDFLFYGAVPLAFVLADRR